MKIYSIVIKKKINSFKKKLSIKSGCKSISHRFFLIASKGIGKSTAVNVAEGSDVLNTIHALRQLNVRIFKKKNIYYCFGNGLDSYHTNKKSIRINCGNSGSTARMLAGTCATFPKKILLTGDSSLKKRDMSRIFMLEKFGAKFEPIGGKKLPLSIIGSEIPIADNFSENIGSSQVKSAYLFGALGSYGTSLITENILSRDHTEKMLLEANAAIKIKKFKKYNLISVDGKKEYNAINIKIPNDPSSAACLVALTLLSKGSEIKLTNILLNKFRIGFYKTVKRFGGNIRLTDIKTVNKEKVGTIIAKSSNLKPMTCGKDIVSSQVDEYPLLFLLAGLCSKSISKFSGISTLRGKESDRILESQKLLKKFNIKTQSTKDSLKIWGNSNVKLNKSYSFHSNDHRMVMTAIIAALTFGGNFKISNVNCINISFPGFLKIMKKIGATYEIKKKY